MQNLDGAYFNDILQTLNFTSNDYNYMRTSSNRQPIQNSRHQQQQQQLMNDTSSSKMNTKIDELMTCFICLQKLSNPVILSCCSKLSCRFCISKWLSKKEHLGTQQCPHCRHFLREDMLVSCRFLEDLGQALIQAQVQDPCPNHPQSSLNYYCLTCSQSVCSECAMFSGHKQHEFERIQTIFEKRAEGIQNEIDNISLKLRGLKEGVHHIDELIDQLNKGKDEKVQEIQQFSETLLSKLEQTHQQRLMILFQQKQSLTQKIHGIHSLKDEVQSQVQTLEKSQFIAQSEKIYQNVQTYKEIDYETGNADGIQLDFPSEISPSYQSAQFELRNFSQHLPDAIIYSQPLIYNGIKWRLKVYPQGNGNARGTFLSVFLEMASQVNFGAPQRYEYKVEMINQRNHKTSVMREFSSEFESGECWGYNRFYKIDLLVKEGYLVENQDKLLFQFYVRSPTYYQETLDMKRYIQQLESQISKKQEVPQESNLKDGESNQSAQEVAVEGQEQPFETEEKRIREFEDEERSSIIKLKKEIEHYAEKIEELEQKSNSENSNQTQSDTSSECYEIDPDDQAFKLKMLYDATNSINDLNDILVTQKLKSEMSSSETAPIRRNLITKFEQEARDEDEQQEKFYQQNNFQSMESLTISEVQRFIEREKIKQIATQGRSPNRDLKEKLDQFKSYSSLLQKRRIGDQNSHDDQFL